jgi:hypothetical protein
MPDPKVSVSISAKNLAKREMSGFNNQLKSTARNALSLKKAFGGLAVAFGARQLFRGAVDLVSAFSQQEDAVVGLNAALQATGRYSEEGSAKIREQASEIQRVTRIGDEALIAATGRLAELAKQIDADELAAAQTALVGIAESFFKGDVQNAALQLGKTIGTNVNALSRYGIQVDSTATQSEKLAQILEQSGAAFEVAKAKTDTVRGAYEQLRNVFGDMKERLGSIIVDTFGLRDATGGLKDKIVEWTDKLEANQPVIVAWGKVVVEALKLVIQAFITIIRVAFNFGQIIGTTLSGTAKLAIGAITHDIGLMGLGAVELQEQFGELKDAILKDVADAGDAVGDLVRQFGNLIEATEKAQQARPGAGVPSPGAPLGPVGLPGIEVSAAAGAPGLNLIPPGALPKLPMPEFDLEIPDVWSDFTQGAKEALGVVDEMQSTVSGFTGNVLGNFAAAASDAFGQFVEGALLGSKAFEGGMSAAIKKVAAAMASFYAAKAMAALGEGIFGDPRGFVAAAKFGAAAAAFATLAAFLPALPSAGGAAAGQAAGQQAMYQTGFGTAGRATQREATIVVQGSSWFDLSDPRAVQQWARVLEKLSGLKITIKSQSNAFQPAFVGGSL